MSIEIFLKAVLVTVLLALIYGGIGYYLKQRKEVEALNEVIALLEEADRQRNQVLVELTQIYMDHMGEREVRDE